MDTGMGSTGFGTGSWAAILTVVIPALTAWGRKLEGWAPEPAALVEQVDLCLKE